MGAPLLLVWTEISAFAADQLCMDGFSASSGTVGLGRQNTLLILIQRHLRQFRSLNLQVPEQRTRQSP